MSTLAELKVAATTKEVEFIAACKAAGFPDEWAAFRAEQVGGTLPESVDKAHADWIEALHAYYLLRDGPKGFLGGRIGAAS